MSQFLEQFNQIFTVLNLRFIDVSRANATNSCCEVFLSTVLLTENALLAWRVLIINQRRLHCKVEALSASGSTARINSPFSLVSFSFAPIRLSTSTRLTNDSFRGEPCFFTIINT